MAKTAQVLSNLNENFFDFFDLAVKNFCGSSLALQGGEVHLCFYFYKKIALSVATAFMPKQLPRHCQLIPAE
jgi:hypothetical protein